MLLHRTWRDRVMSVMQSCTTWNCPRDDKWLLIPTPEFNWPTWSVRKRPFDWTIDA